MEFTFIVKHLIFRNVKHLLFRKMSDVTRNK